MFTGIIETLGTITKIDKENGNLHLTIKSDFTSELKIDQSVSHNGICMTVVAIQDDKYTVTAIKETIDKSALSHLTISDQINLERAAKLNDRLDGHIVQGHVDSAGKCVSIEPDNGSTIFTFSYKSEENITVEKGSITVNGVSLTVVNSQIDRFSVAIIPFTYQHTTFKNLKVGDWVNLEFDIIGKYIAKLYTQNT